MKKILILFLFVTYSLNCFAITKAFEFNLKGSDGKKYSLSQLRGKVVVLEWYNEGCPFVRKFYDVEHMQDLQKEAKDNVVWLTVASSAKGKQGHIATVSDAKKLHTKEKMHSQAILLDHSGVVGSAYNAKTTPHMFIINKKGNIVYDGAIDSLPSTNSSDIKTAKPYFRTALTSTLKDDKFGPIKNKSYGCSVKY